METRVSLKPGAKGTRQLQEKYGYRLVQVRYRYDAKARMRYKTVELIVDAKPYMPENSAKYHSEVAVRIDFHENELREKAKTAGARWDPGQKVWRMRYMDALDLNIEDRIQPKKSRR